jgi:hypothetical protein
LKALSTPAGIAKAQALARECMNSSYKNYGHSASSHINKYSKQKRLFGSFDLLQK